MCSSRLDEGRALDVVVAQGLVLGLLLFSSARLALVLLVLSSSTPLVGADAPGLLQGDLARRLFDLELLLGCCRADGLALRHRRGVHAMGGMAAQIPIKHDEQANEAAMNKVKADKEREVTDGHDGTWVAHPALVPLAKDIFDAHMPNANQIEKKREDVDVNQDDLLRVPEGNRTDAGLRQNISIGIQYIEAWLRGVGCVPLHNLMEDAATAEISRAQLWQWIRHKATLEDGRVVTPTLFRETMEEETSRTVRQQMLEEMVQNFEQFAAEPTTRAEAIELVASLKLSLQ